MITLVHEDIYVYVDPIKEKQWTLKGNDIDFSNYSNNQIVDPGVFNITVTSGSYDSLVITTRYNSLTLSMPLPEGSELVLDFTNKHFILDGSQIFLDNLIELKDDDYSNINLSFTGTGEKETTYSYFAAEENFDDVYFVESIDVTESTPSTKRTNVKGSTKLIPNAKKDYSFSINGLWNAVELSKFPELFRLRLTDEEGTLLETLSHCRIDDKKKSSSSGGDYTYSISGVCEKIF